MNVLLVENDVHTSTAIQQSFKDNDLVSVVAESGEEGLDLATIGDYDAVVQDLVLPDMSGITCLRGFKRRRIVSPICLLAENSKKGNEGLNQGADTYVCKHTDMHEELVARIKAICRRCSGHNDVIASSGDLSINMTASIVMVRNVPIHLTNQQYRLVHTLFLRQGKIVSKQALFDNLHLHESEAGLKLVDVVLCKVRAAIRAAGGISPITVEWGQGCMIA